MRDSPTTQSALLKRSVDLLVAAGALAVLGLPLLVIAWLVRLDSPGPVFFRQLRVGQGGRLFRIHKFRTMRLDADQHGPQLTVGADPRITRMGQWLRRRRIDELPQFIDVLLGDMSLVGPRPEVPRYVALYPEDLRLLALAVKPGITDPASLEFRDEAAWLAAATDPEREYVEVILPKKLACSVSYIQRATLATDLAVLCRTVLILFRH